MCGRFTLRRTNYELQQTFYPRFAVDWRPRFNIAPKQRVLVIRESPTTGKAEALPMEWGLTPPWSRVGSTGSKMFHLKAESLLEKPAHIEPFSKRRCLILADGFYEWRDEYAGTRPYFVHRKDDQPFAFAGEWQVWRIGGIPVRSCTLVITEANFMMRALHEQMPVILPPNGYARWLDSSYTEPRRLLTDLALYNWYEMEAYPVSPKMNDASYDAPDCVEEYQV